MLKNAVILVLALIALNPPVFAEPTPRPFVLNNTQVIPIASKNTGRQHELVVVLPASYASNPKKTYPVLYYLDAYWDTPLLVSTYGNLVYDKETPEFIMVGLSYPTGANYDRERRIDYTISKVDQFSGKSEAFLNFIRTEVAPLIESRFRGEPGQRILAGSSLGGLFAISAAYAAPDFFKAHIAISPAVSWDNGALVKIDERFASSGKPLNSRMFISYGGAEAAGFRNPIVQFQQTLAGRRYQGFDLQNHVMPGLDHTSVKGDGFVRGLIWAFKPLKPTGPSGLTQALGAQAALENSGAGCAIGAQAALDALQANPKLPNPFVFANGQPVVSKADWICRRAEIGAQAQHFELGDKPAGAQRVEARVEQGNLMVNVGQGGKQISFPVRITLPAGGKAPYPALIGVGAATLNNDELLRQGVAIISFPNNEIAAQQNAGSRGQGKFYELYGSDHPAGAMSAWSWGISRVIDALERTPAAQIDARRLGVTGCSRNGKGAIVAGALDERIALTIAQESGSGGAAGWRVSDSQLAAGQKVQTLRQIVTENVWFRDSFRQFGESAARLPFDQHSVMALIAPRALLVVENTSMEWLGNQSAYVNALAAREVWKAHGAQDAMGVSQIGGHAHCQLPASQAPIVNSFVKKFLLGDGSADTRMVATDGKFSTGLSAWVDWATPTLR